MNLLERLAEMDGEQVVFCHDALAGLRGLIAIHDTTLGPAMGGLRIHPYPSEEEALEDALRLSRAMTMKASAAGLNLGGGCAVVICDLRQGKSEALLRAFGRQVEGLGGRFTIAEDAGTTVEDMETIAQETRYVVGLNKRRGGSGDPALKAALGVFHGIQACLEAVFGDRGLRNRRVAIQGVGAVGLELARLLGEEGAALVVADTDSRRIDKVRTFLQAEVVAPEKISGVDCDVFSPCALGGVLTEAAVAGLRARIVAGSANNQLESERVGDLLHARGITYAPDFVINAGGLINAAEELQGYDETTANAKIGKLFQTIQTILRLAREKSIPSHVAANQWAQDRIRVIRDVRRTFLPAEH
ncbi:MAG: Glu/Leu/Phe/Val dehydrogenase [Candidatus Riflebacteria bacterium]|nr:Glu/Leu/Phe/Val dehydrogenase [Candidatus Riflebacteria bacterium]